MKKFMRKTATLAVAVVVAASSSGCAFMNRRWELDCLVKAKDTLYTGKQGAPNYERRIATSCGQFKVGDAWEAGMFNSYDVWSQIEVGKRYDIRVGGFRVGFMSMFPNVLEVSEVNEAR